VPAHSSRVPPDTVAPRFTLPSASGGEVSLADYRGRFHVVLVFLRGAR
jgi:peroxiredoxin